VSRASFANLAIDIRACRVCAGKLAHEPRPVFRAQPSARLVIAGQAPGTRVHASGVPFTDPSGDRLRNWLGIDSETFYDERRVAVIPMGFCFPGLDANGGDLPPRRECAPLWHERLFAEMKQVKLTLAVGLYAQAWHLKGRTKANLTETVKAWRAYGPEILPLPHPSWRNNAWVMKNPWFESELLPVLRKRVAKVLAD
jgi:uracil-DNA glycosylase